jgi:hypothetical protein
MLTIPSKERDICSFVVPMADQAENNGRQDKSYNDEKCIHIA